MALRFVLVGLVASLGFEMPGGPDVSSWARTGRDWFNARMAEVTSLRSEAERALALAADCERSDDQAPAPNAEVAPTRLDLTFDAVVDGMARDFSADQASIEVARPVEEAIAAVDPTDGPTVEMPEVACLDPTADEDGVDTLAEAGPEPEPATAPATEVVSRVERISTAVRLTRRAMEAWASLIQPSALRVAGESGDDSP
jgi:hypothetical protein